MDSSFLEHLEELLVKIEGLPDNIKWYLGFLNGDITPREGKKDPPRGPRDGTIDVQGIQVDEEKYFLIKGVPHPEFKGLYYNGGDTHDRQYWKVGNWFRPERFSPKAQKVLREYGLKWCNKCRRINHLHNFGVCKIYETVAHCKFCREKHQDIYKAEGKSKIAAKKHMQKIQKTISGNTSCRLRTSLKKSLISVGLKKLSDKTFDYIGCDIHSFVEKNKEGLKKYRRYDIDHIAPSSLAGEIESRRIWNENWIRRTIYAVWHYSNLQVLDPKTNQHKKSNYINGKRVPRFSDEELLNLAKNLIQKTEEIRKKDGQTPKDLKRIIKDCGDY